MQICTFVISHATIYHFISLNLLDLEILSEPATDSDRIYARENYRQIRNNYGHLLLSRVSRSFNYLVNELAVIYIFTLRRLWRNA